MVIFVIYSFYLYCLIHIDRYNIKICQYFCIDCVSCEKIYEKYYYY